MSCGFYKGYDIKYHYRGDVMSNNNKSMAIRSANIIEARFSLTARQNDILDMLFAEIDNDEKLTYEISVEKYKPMYKTNTSNIYRDLKKAIKSFEGKGFYLIDKANNEETYYPWFSKIKYKNKEGKILLDVHSDLKKQMYEAKQKIYYDIYYTLNFASTYSKRVYHYLKFYENTGWRRDSISELIRKLECPPSYLVLRNLEKYVLTVAKEEINSGSDILFDYDVEKVGRKPMFINFRIRKKVDILAVEELALDINSEIDSSFIKNIVVEDITNEDINNIIKICKELDYDKEKFKSINEYFIKNYNMVKKYFYNTAKGEGSFIAILITALKNDWTKSKMKKMSQENNVSNKTRKFNNYNQRQYNMDKLEQGLLGWETCDSIDELYK